MQRERLRRLLRPWLEHGVGATEVRSEAERGKSSDDVQIGPLHLSLRVDRVDETEGGELVIDYKTGRVSTNDWLSERPDAPQLPLYAVVSDAEQLGVWRLRGFVRARRWGGRDLRREMACCSKPDEVEGRESFAAQVEEWREVLTSLAEQFSAGEAGVRPKSYPKTCTYCGQRLLCRVVGVSLEETEEEETDAAAGVSGVS